MLKEINEHFTNDKDDRGIDDIGHTKPVAPEILNQRTGQLHQNVERQDIGNNVDVMTCNAFKAKQHPNGFNQLNGTDSDPGNDKNQDEAKNDVNGFIKQLLQVFAFHVFPRATSRRFN
jgi:hypothetical protein